MYQIQRQQTDHIQDHRTVQIVAAHRHVANTYPLSWWVQRLCRLARHLFRWLIRSCLLKAICHHRVVLNLCLSESGWVYGLLWRRLCFGRRRASVGVFSVPYVLVLASLPQEQVVRWMFKLTLSPAYIGLYVIIYKRKAHSLATSLWFSQLVFSMCVQTFDC